MKRHIPSDSFRDASGVPILVWEGRILCAQRVRANTEYVAGVSLAKLVRRSRYQTDRSICMRCMTIARRIARHVQEDTHDR